MFLFFSIIGALASNNSMNSVDKLLAAIQFKHMNLH
jgi:hypothetical protein